MGGGGLLVKAKPLHLDGLLRHGPPVGVWLAADLTPSLAHGEEPAQPRPSFHLGHTPAVCLNTGPAVGLPACAACQGVGVGGWRGHLPTGAPQLFSLEATPQGARAGEVSVNPISPGSPPPMVLQSTPAYSPTRWRPQTFENPHPCSPTLPQIGDKMTPQTQVLGCFLEKQTYRGSRGSV